MTSRAAGRRERAALQYRLLCRFMAEAPFQPATNFWRCVELPTLAGALPKEGRGLDIGCGDGVLTGILGDLVGAHWRLVGVDPNPQEAERARTSGRYESVHATGADRIPEPADSFDFAFANSVLEHIPDLPACLRDIGRCLKPTGLLAATVPSVHFHTCLAGPDWSQTLTRPGYLREIDARLAHAQYWSSERWGRELLAACLEMEAESFYLSRRQVRRWEAWSNWTGGLLYRLRRRKESMIDIQQNLSLKRGLPSPLRPLAPLLARCIGQGVLGHEETGAAANGCLLLLARKKGGPRG
jgi:SAM-dependent methyltransferase